MPYVLRFIPEGKQTLQQLHIRTQRELKQVLKQVAAGEKTGKELSGPLQGLWTIASRNHRAVYAIEATLMTVIVVGHRSVVYDVATQLLQTQPRSSTLSDATSTQRDTDTAVP